MILKVLERLEGLSVRGANRKGIAQRQHSKKTLLFDALEWRSKVEFRAGHALILTARIYGVTEINKDNTIILKKYLYLLCRR